MAVEAFLKLDGIPGESQKDGHVNEIELFSFSWGASNPTSVSLGTGSGVGKVDLSSLTVQTEVATQSPKLFLACASGQHIKTGKLTVRESGGSDKPLDYLTYDMEEVFVDSVSWGGASGGGKPSESTSMSFKKITMTYWPQKGDGTLGDKIQTGWDVSINKKI
jgi:type VI secretion system secreted protein Hcp